MSYNFGGDSPPASSSASSSSASSASGSSSAAASSSSASSSAGGSSSAASSSSSSSSPAVTAVSPSSASSSSASSSSSSSPGISSGTIAITTSFVVVGGVVLIVVAVLIIKYVQKRMLEITSGGVGVDTVPLNSIVCEDPNNSKNEGGSMESFLDEFFKDKPMRFTPQDLKGFTSDYSAVLGSGGFGVVYEGQLSNGVPVAVKILHETLGKIAEGQFTREVSTLSRTNHVNLVRLYGFCFDANVKALVYEYMDCGSLDQYLFGDDRLQWEKLYEIAVGIAKGIRYLNEECDNKIIHFDIKPANILLSKNFFPKVADFGLAELCERETTLVTITGGKGTPGFVAPELWIPLPEIDKCDVYSFGMLLFEILWSRWSLELAQAESKEKLPRWVWEKVEQQELERVIMDCGDGDSRMKIERMCKVALWCVQHQPERRPLMSKVVKMLEGEEKIDAPLNPFNSMVPSVK